MNKAERIERYGEEAYERLLERGHARYKAHQEEIKERTRKWALVNQNKVIATRRERCRKGGKYYEKHLKDSKTGLQGARNRIRVKHANQYRPYKDIIAPESQIHHEWIPKTAEYRGMALVEKDPHQYGIIDVIQILDGVITLLTEEDVRKGFEEKEEKAKKDKMTEEDKKKGRYLQLHYYVSDADETLILQAGIEVGRFLDICVEDAVKHAKMNLEAE